MHYAIIYEGRVVNVVVAEKPLDENWIASEVASIGDIYQNGEFLKPVALPTTAEVAARRYVAEVAGITVNDMRVDTSRDSQSLITGAALQATIDSTYTCRWKTASGFVDLSAAQILSVATAVRTHVQACFDREAVLLGELEAGTFTADMLEQGWP